MHLFFVKNSINPEIRKKLKTAPTLETRDFLPSTNPSSKTTPKLNAAPRESHRPWNCLTNGCCATNADAAILTEGSAEKEAEVEAGEDEDEPW
jgi:hypothetical protein